MALDFGKPGPSGTHTVEAPNGRTWVWDKSKWVLSHEAYLIFKGDDPIQVGTTAEVNNGVTSLGIRHYLDATDLSDLPEPTTDAP